MYETYVGYEFEIENRIHSLIRLSRDITKYPYSTPQSYHEAPRNSGKGLWRIEKDASLNNYGAEFISPPEKLEKSLEIMKAFLGLVKKNRSNTTFRCGCHINMCLTCRGKILKMDEDAILANINWRLLYFLWSNRIKNHNVYCVYMKKILQQYKNGNSFLAKATSKSGIGKEIFKQSHGFIVKKTSLMKKKGNYYELRFPGGTNYHKSPEKIEQTVRHFAKIFMKSRLSAVSKLPNKRIVSYINRTQSIFSANCAMTKDCIESIPYVKTLANTYVRDGTVGRWALNDKVWTITNRVLAKLTHGTTYFSENDQQKLKKIIQKNHLLYYLAKYAFFNYTDTNNKSLADFNPLQRLAPCNLEFTIPKEESDLDKLWLSRLCRLSLITPKDKERILKSIKNKKIKEIFNKMTENATYRHKIIQKQIIRKRNNKKMLEERIYAPTKRVST